MPDHLDSREFVTLRDYFERLLLERDKSTEHRLSDAKTALDKAASNLDIRLAELREYKDQLKEQTANFVTISTVEAKLDVLRADINIVKTSLRGLENNQANVDNRVWAIGAGVTVINIVLAIAGYVLGK